MKEIKGSSVENIMCNIVMERCDSYHGDVVHDGRFMGINNGKCFIWIVCDNGTHIVTNEDSKMVERVLMSASGIVGMFFINDTTKRVIEFDSVEEMKMYLSMTGVLVDE